MLKIFLVVLLALFYLCSQWFIAPYMAGYVAGILCAMIVYSRYRTTESVNGMLHKIGQFESLDISRYQFKRSWWFVIYILLWPVACVVEGVVMAYRFSKDPAYFPQ